MLSSGIDGLDSAIRSQGRSNLYRSPKQVTGKLLLIRGSPAGHSLSRLQINIMNKMMGNRRISAHRAAVLTHVLHLQLGGGELASCLWQLRHTTGLFSTEVASSLGPGDPGGRVFSTVFHQLQGSRRSLTARLTGSRPAPIVAPPKA